MGKPKKPEGDFKPSEVLKDPEGAVFDELYNRNKKSKFRKRNRNAVLVLGLLLALGKMGFFIAEKFQGRQASRDTTPIQIVVNPTMDSASLTNAKAAKGRIISFELKSFKILSTEYDKSTNKPPRFPFEFNITVAIGKQSSTAPSVGYYTISNRETNRTPINRILYLGIPEDEFTQSTLIWTVDSRGIGQTDRTSFYFYPSDLAKGLLQTNILTLKGRFASNPKIPIGKCEMVYEMNNVAR